MSDEAIANQFADAGRWVLLLHETPVGAVRPTHFDLMLEKETCLATWACEANPFNAARTTARRLADHRLAYLQYEGEISNGRGHVRRVGAGTFQAESNTGEQWFVQISGDHIGRLVIPLANESEVELRFEADI